MLQFFFLILNRADTECAGNMLLRYFERKISSSIISLDVDAQLEVIFTASESQWCHFRAVFAVTPDLKIYFCFITASDNAIIATKSETVEY